MRRPYLTDGDLRVLAGPFDDPQMAAIEQMLAELRLGRECYVDFMTEAEARRRAA
ncbi:hypothetical protein [Halobaculum sp. EA56]|uniref:hypothetical protein n=1 Tax=Halobaculum sp. EA56 TaxID=3421648 RepID=UPI003EB6ABEF